MSRPASRECRAVAFRRSNGRAPKLLDLGECGAVVFISADRADLHGGPRQNFATVRASMASMGTIASAVDISFPPYRDIPFALRLPSPMRRLGCRGTNFWICVVSVNFKWRF